MSGKKKVSLESNDQIRWCAKNLATNYYIEFIDSGNGTPLGIDPNTPGNDFLINKNSVQGWVCTDFLTPLTGKPTGNTEYTYLIKYDTTFCSDPKVILK